MSAVFLYSDPHFSHQGVCVEATDFAPILFEESCAKIVEQGGQLS